MREEGIPVSVFPFLLSNLSCKVFSPPSTLSELLKSMCTKFNFDVYNEISRSLWRTSRGSTQRYLSPLFDDVYDVNKQVLFTRLAKTK